MRRVDLSNKLLQSVHQYLAPLLARCRTPEQRRHVYDKYYPLILKHVRKWYAGKLNPFNLTPRTIMIWLLIRPNNAIGVSLIGLQKIAIYWRQQLEPNETVFLLIKLIDLRVPFPLMLLIAFGSIGLIVTDGANRLVKAAQTQFEEVINNIQAKLDGLSDTPADLLQSIANMAASEERQQAVKLFDPFNLTTRMSVYLPIYNYQTTLGILLMDFRRLEFSIKQALEPNETFLSIIRIFDICAPFPLPIMVILLSVGLFFVGKIQDLIQAAREDIINDVKRSMP